MNKEQTALDVSRDIELKKVMPQQAALTLTDEQIIEACRGIYLSDYPLGSASYDVAVARAILALLPTSPKASPGYVLVPAEPTENMVTAGFESWPDQFFSKPEDWEAFEQMTGCQQAAHKARLCYAAMLAAAPKVDAAVPADQGVREAARIFEGDPARHIRFDFVNADGNEDSKIITHDEMRERYATLQTTLRATLGASQGAPKESEPVAWLWLQHGKPVNAFLRKPSMIDPYWTERGFSIAPLYAAPISQQDSRNADKLKPGHCHKCGLPMVTNPHPEAGKPGHYLEVGCPTECLPCMVSSRHAWSKRASKAEMELRELQASRNAVLEAPHTREAIARAIWNVRREDEDRCDMELEDMGKSHSVWKEADAAIRALKNDPPQQDSKEQGNGN